MEIFFARQKIISRIKFLIGLLFIGLVVACFQGGIISTSLKSVKSVNIGKTFAASGEQSFTINKQPFEITTSENKEENVPLFSLLFFKEFGLTPILFLIALYVLKRNKKIILLASIGIISFVIPFLIVYVSRPWELTRIFNISTALFSFILAFLIYFLFDKHKENIKIKLSLILLSLCVVYGGLAFQVVCMITPFSKFGEINVPFAANLPEPSASDQAVYGWILKNTKNYDRFFPYDPILMIRTGRMSPGNYPSLFPGYKIPIYKDIYDSCGIASIGELKINYLIISPSGFSLNDYRNKCGKINANLVFRVDRGIDYREIYKVD